LRPLASVLVCWLAARWSSSCVTTCWTSTACARTGIDEKVQGRS
jgi:hypothetical protein